MEQGAWAILLLFAGILAVQLFQGGPEQLKAWLESKFLGKTSRKVKDQI